MKSRKLIPVLAATLVLCAAAVTAIFFKGTAEVTYDYIQAFIDSPFYSGIKPVQYSDPLFSELHPGLHGLTDDSDFSYWMDEQGRICYIRQLDKAAAFPETVLPGYTAASVAEDSKKWFDKAFFKEEKIFGSETAVSVSDFNGGDYTATINLTYKGFETGNSASVAFSADGRLISAVFIHSNATVEELYREPAISKESAVKLAYESLEKECLELYGSDAILYIEKAASPETELKIFHDRRYWEVNVNVPTENLVDFEDHYVLYASIRIDSETGSCLGIATPLK